MPDDKNVQLREAVARNDLEGVRTALDDGADIHAADAMGYTPLHRAVSTARTIGTEMLELLLRSGADPNKAEAGYLNAFELAVTIADVRRARRLLEAGAHLSRTAFNKADGKPEMLSLLEEWPIRSSTSSEPDKQLLLAARTGNLEEVSALLRAGANPAACDAEGRSAFDHAWTKKHASVAFALERAAAERDANAGLFLAALDNSIGGVLKAADTFDLEARTQGGMTALMLAARYRRYPALHTLLSRGAQVDSRNGASTALVYAIESGDLEIMQTLLDRGAACNYDVDGNNPVLRAACAQVDTDLLKQLLMRGIDVTPYPRLGGLDETYRLLSNARAGVLPIAGPPSFSPWQECSVCRDLPDVMGWCRSASGEHTGEPLATITEQFETFDWSRHGLWKCPWCGAYYAHQTDHDNGITDGWDSEDLKRVSLEEARAALRTMSPTPRIEREIASLSEAISFNEAIAVPGDGKVQISGTEVRDGTRALMIYSLTDHGAKRLAWRCLREGEHDAQVARLKARGFAVAETEFLTEIVWVITADGLEVYDDRHQQLHAAGDRATLEDGRIVERSDLAHVFAWAEEEYVYRGVKAVLRSGEEVELVIEIALAAMPGSQYNRNDLLCDSGWCTTLGRAIASWAGATFEARI